MVQVPDVLDYLNLLSLINPSSFGMKWTLGTALDEEFGIFPMKTTSKTTPKTIINLIAVGSLILGASYPVWGPSAVSASSVKQTASKPKTLTQTPTTPASTDPLPTTPASPSGSGGATMPSVPASGGGGTVTTPEAPAPATPSSPAPAAATTGKTVVDIAAGNKELKTLTAALKAAGLEETLSGTGPFTVFAPTDKAFAALPPGTVDELLKPENKDKLVQLLTYHVVSGKLDAASLTSGDVPSLQGKPIAVKVQSKKVMVNEATVTQADVPASNGVIHLIDKVILPAG
jgi:uncharacterized surface protein with fasciclin (FAS1) repeats